MNQKQMEVQKAILELHTMALNGLNVVSRCPAHDENQRKKRFEMESRFKLAYDSEMSRIRELTDRNEVGFSDRLRQLRYPPEADFIITELGPLSYTSKIRFNGEDPGTILRPFNNTIMKVLWRNADSEPCHYNIVSIDVTRKNIDIFEHMQLFFLEYKKRRLEQYRSSHPNIFFSKPLVSLLHEKRVPKPRELSQSPKMLDATTYRKGDLVGRPARSMRLLVVVPDENGGDGSQIHDPITGTILTHASLSESDIVMRATETIFARVEFVLRMLTGIYKEIKILESKGRLKQGSEPMEALLDQLAKAQLDKSDDSSHVQSKPGKKRCRVDDDASS
jgi:hypothetical protein